MTTAPLRILTNYNQVEIHKDVVIKRFASHQRMSNELSFHRIFREHFDVPRIMEVDEARNVVAYERVDGTPVSEPAAFNRLGLREMVSLRNRVPKLHGTAQGNMLADQLDPCLIRGELVHGDMRLDNFILSGSGRVYLIDFEAGNYLFRELDDAYLGISIGMAAPGKEAEYDGMVAPDRHSMQSLLAGKLTFVRGVLMNPHMAPERKAFWLRRGEMLSDEAKALRRGEQKH